VFQDYALFPHMSVLENVLYGPRARGVCAREAMDRAKGAMARLGIEKLAPHKPPRLSGGQRQRVALARALASEPLVILLDEPMSALDARTRRRVRFEIRELIERIGIPTVAVAHDPEDALTLGDSVCVMEQGRIIQSGRRAELMQRPRSLFLAEFMGLNLFRGVATPVSEELSEVRCGDTVLLARGTVTGPACLTVRPTAVRFPPPGTEVTRNGISGMVTSLSHTGQAVRATVENGIVIYCEMSAELAEEIRLAPGQRVVVTFDPADATCYEEAEEA
jgi:ABC-type Fe3+/spermidine/putrescine transport system ATPase subunit